MYNFDKMVNRRNTNSLKWDVKENELPMWVADMDFQTAPAIVDALHEKINLGIFGYSIISKEWEEAIINWWHKRHDFLIQKEWLIFTTGVIPAVSCAVKRFTNTGDNIVTMTPVYDIFFHSIENHGRHVLEEKLQYKEYTYSIDFESLEQKLAHPLTTMLILCNPHNPIGKIWSKEELCEIGRLCQKHHVIVLSDEIHCDLTDPTYAYTPFANASEVCANNSITCISASKAFNMAGMQAAAVIAPSEKLRNIIERGLNSDEIAEPNVFAQDAVIAAFTKGEEWLDELRTYLYGNKQLVSNFLEKEIPNIKLVDSKATYLLWIDCSQIEEEAVKLCNFIREKTGLYLASGDKYRGNGPQFMRMNIACSTDLIKDGLNRLKTGIELYQKK